MWVEVHERAPDGYVAAMWWELFATRKPSSYRHRAADRAGRGSAPMSAPRAPSGRPTGKTHVARESAEQDLAAMRDVPGSPRRSWRGLMLLGQVLEARRLAAIYFAIGRLDAADHLPGKIARRLFEHRRDEWAGRLTIAAIGIAWHRRAVDARQLDRGGRRGARRSTPTSGSTLFDLHDLTLGRTGSTASRPIMVVVVTSVCAARPDLLAVGTCTATAGYARYYAFMSALHRGDARAGARRRACSMLFVLLGAGRARLELPADRLLVPQVRAAAAAAKKAFIVTRFGDFGLPGSRCC